MTDPIPRGVLVMVLENRGLQPNEIREIMAAIDEAMREREEAS